MFRPIRRKTKEINIDDAKALLTNERRGVLAVNGDEGYPYAVPINFFYDDAEQKIYFHGAGVGHKADSIKNCDKVCFTVYGHESIKDLDWAPYMQSVVVFGRCQVITDSEVKLDKLRQFARKYYPSEEAITEEIAEDGAAATMYEIAIEHMTGKEIQER